MTTVMKLCFQRRLKKAAQFYCHRYTHQEGVIAPSQTEKNETPLFEKPFEAIPGPTGLPYIGTLFHYTYGPYSVPKYHEALKEHYKKYGKIFKETITGETVVHLLDPDYIREVYAQEGKIPHIPPLLETTQRYREYRQMSPGLGNTNGEEWYRLRTNINQMMMRPQAVTQFIPHVNGVADDFIKHIYNERGARSGQVPNFSNELLRWTLETSAMTCFERRLNCFEADADSYQQKMIDANKDIFTLSLKLRFSIPWYKTAPKLSKTWRKLITAEDYFFTTGQKFVDETVQKIKDLQEDGESLDGRYLFLTYLLGRDELSYKDLSIIALSLFADGLSTTNPSLIGQLYCLASNPEKQEILREEVNRLAPDPSESITADMINKASYLKACIKEGFRFFPIGTEVSRLPQKDLVIGGYHIPKGTHLELNNNLLLRMSEYVEDPETYQPERWIRGDSGSNTHPYLLLPFGFGPRTCAGRRFAEQEMQVLIIKLLQHYRLEWPHRYAMSQRYNMLLTPDCPADFKFVHLQ